MNERSEETVTYLRRKALRTVDARVSATIGAEVVLPVVMQIGQPTVVMA